ncbi:hypothetical protein [Streptomyces sp. NPDC054863]
MDHVARSFPPGSIIAPPLPPLSGTEPFAGLDDTVLDFWRFAMSDLRTNTVRGYLAEFLVARAVGASANRVEWDAYDVLSPDGVKIEVKAGGYVQAWSQTRASKDPRWDIPQTVPTDPSAREAHPPQTHEFQADVYVFALHGARTHDQYDALDLGQWRFHVLSRTEVMALPRGSKGHALATLRRVRDICAPVGFKTLADEICKANRPRHGPDALPLGNGLDTAVGHR